MVRARGQAPDSASENLTSTAQVKHGAAGLPGDYQHPAEKHDSPGLREFRLCRFRQAVERQAGQQNHYRKR